MVTDAIKRLEDLCEIIPKQISALDDKVFCYKSSSLKWSKKEILGHLIDSASNNHQRFVRIQFEDTPYISYDPDNWNAHNYYNALSSEHLVLFWTSYNKHLAALLQYIPEKNYQRPCKVGEHTVVTLEFLITDYVEHLEHHLKQIVNYIPNT